MASGDKCVVSKVKVVCAELKAAFYKCDRLQTLYHDGIGSFLNLESTDVSFVFLLMIFCNLTGRIGYTRASNDPFDLAFQHKIPTLPVLIWK
jgi:hypothetical protein